MRKISERVDRLSYRYHWLCIDRLRARAQQLLDNGTACNNPQLVGVSNKILMHGICVSRIWKRYNGSTSTTLPYSDLREQVTV